MGEKPKTAQRVLEELAIYGEGYNAAIEMMRRKAEELKTNNKAPLPIGFAPKVSAGEGESDER